VLAPQPPAVQREMERLAQVIAGARRSVTGVQLIHGKPVRFSRHALQQMAERGAIQEEVLEAIRSGEQVPAKHGRVGYRRNFQYQRLWGGR
jgi:hypothetical protein